MTPPRVTLAGMVEGGASGGRRSRLWLPAVVVGAGALLATLSILLAAWSKQLVKESLRAECAQRAAFVAGEAQRGLDAHVAALVRGGARPPEAAAVWRLGEGGAVVSRDPATAPDPAPALVEATRAPGAAPRPISVRGPAAPLAGTWVPLPAGGADGARGLLVRWDLDAVEASILRPLVAPPLADGWRRFELALVRDDRPHDLALMPKASSPLAPPLDAWQVLVGLDDPEAVRWALRAQTVLLYAVAAWLLLLLAASVIAWARRERAHAVRVAAREQLLARAYHELQTPLMLLRAAAESLERGAVERPDEVRRCVEIVGREEERLTRNVRRLLRWLRVEGGDEAGLGPLREEVEAAARELEPTLRERGVRLELSLDGAVAGLRAPRDLVSDVVRELLVNVEKHARGATRVRVELAQGPRRGVARIVVDDDGPGWRQGEQPPASGFGLGLLREGLLLCGGTLRLEAGATGRGARAVVEVPAHA
jgi:signal transduction histidine kinase